MQISIILIGMSAIFVLCRGASLDLRHGKYPVQLFHNFVISQGEAGEGLASLCGQISVSWK